MPLRLLRTEKSEKLVFDIVQEHQIVRRDDRPEAATEDTGRQLIRFAILSHRWRDGEVEFHDCADIELAKQKKGWAKLEAFMALARSQFLKYVWIDTCCIDKSSSTELAEALNSMFRWYQIAHTCVAYLDDVHNDIKPVKIEPEMRENHHNQSFTTFHHYPSNRDLHLTRTYAASSLVEDLLRTRSLPVAHTSSRNSEVDSEVDETSPKALTLPDGPYQTRLDSTYLHYDWYINIHTVDDYNHYCAYGESPNYGDRWSSITGSEWFTRGWTLQEMLAPSVLTFYDAAWNVIGYRAQLADLVENITGVDRELLKDNTTLHFFSTAQKLSWAANRKTARVEDRAYSLLGILDVSLSIIYGEGPRAFLRLQEELLRTSADATIFAWHDHHDSVRSEPHWLGNQRKYSNLLASSPEAFQDCGRYVPIANQQRAHHVIGSQVQFETNVFVPFYRKSSYDSEARQAILCCYDDSDTTLVTLNLVPALNSKGTYLVAGGVNRLKEENLFKAAAVRKAGVLNVWRFADDAQVGEYEDAWQMVLCRCIDSKHDETSQLEILTGEPAENWQSEDNLFNLPAEFNGVLRLRLKGTSTTNIKLSVRLDRDDGLVIGFPWWQSMRIPARPYWLQDLLSVRWCRDQVITARVHSLTLLHLETQVIEISLISIDAALLRSARWIILKLLHGILLSVAVSPVTFSIIVPIMTMVLIRMNQAAPQQDPMDTPEIITLCLGALFGTCIFLIVDHRVARHVPDGSMRPSEGVVRFVSVLPVAVSRAVKYVLIPLRSWYILAMNVASIVLCAVYLHLSQTHRWNIMSHGLGGGDAAISSLTAPKGIYCAIIRISFCAVLILLSWSNVDIIRLGLTIGIAVPLIQVGMAGMPFIVPWTNRACSQVLISSVIPSTGTSFYFQYASSTSQDPATVCQNFSYQGKMLWAIVGLALVEGLFALLTIPYTRGLRSPKEVVLNVIDFFKLLRHFQSLYHR